MLDSLHPALVIPYYLRIPDLKEIRRNLILTSEKNQYNHVMRSGGINMLNCNDSNGIIMRTSNFCIVTLPPPPPPIPYFPFRIYWVTNS